MINPMKGKEKEKFLKFLVLETVLSMVKSSDRRRRHHRRHGKDKQRENDEFDH